MKFWLYFLLCSLPVFTVEAIPFSREHSFPRGYYSGDPVPPSTIFLTFDDGPAPDTASILDILKEKGVKATFFINAFNRYAPPGLIAKENNLLRYKAVLKRMVEEGHVIGNHTFSHRDLASLRPEQIVWQLDTVQKDLDAALGEISPKLRLIRPPFGSPWLGAWGTEADRAKVARAIEERGLVMNWTRAWDSSDSLDLVPGEIQRLQNPSFSPPVGYIHKEKNEIQRLLRHADGLTSGIVLFHDTHPTSRDVLAQVIDAYQALGYHFGTLEDYSYWRWGPTAFDAFPQ
jgi:peptidoglycan/xylan/chitin deacetylase (PgdA/CDA1 family)